MFKKSLVVFSAVLYSSLVMAQNVEFVGEEENNKIDIPTYTEEVFIPHGGGQTFEDVRDVYPDETTQALFGERETVDEHLDLEQEDTQEPLTFFTPSNMPETYNDNDVDEENAEKLAPDEIMESVREEENKIEPTNGWNLSENMKESVVEKNIDGVDGEKIEAFIEDAKEEMTTLTVAEAENMKLPEADEEMVAKIRMCLPKEYQDRVEFNIDVSTNALEVFGKQEIEGSVLDYKITRNLPLAMVVDDIEKEKTIGVFNGVDDTTENLTALDGTAKSMNNMQVRKINGNDFISVIDEEAKDVVLARRIGAYTALEIQAKGDKYKKMSRDFVVSLSDECIKTAVQDDGRNLDIIRMEVEKKLKDPERMKEIMQNMQQPEQGDE